MLSCSARTFATSSGRKRSKAGRTSASSLARWSSSSRTRATLHGGLFHSPWARATIAPRPISSRRWCSERADMSWVTALSLAMLPRNAKRGPSSYGQPYRSGRESRNARCAVQDAPATNFPVSATFRLAPGVERSLRCRRESHDNAENEHVSHGALGACLRRFRRRSDRHNQ